MPARSGGSGMVSAIVAMRVGSCSDRSRSKNSSISTWNACTVALTHWIRVSTTAECASISPSSAFLRVAIRASVSSRTRATSTLDHSRTTATSSSARRRRSAASTCEAAWISSTAVFESARNRATVSSRALSAAACIARLRSAMSFVGRRAGAGSSIRSCRSWLSGRSRARCVLDGRWIVRAWARSGSVWHGCGPSRAATRMDRPDIGDLGAAWQRGSV